MNAMVHGSECLTEELLARLTLGELDGPELARVEDHVGDCERCSDLLDSSAMDEQWRDRVLPVLREPLECYHPDGEGGGDGEDGHRDEASHGSVLKMLSPTDDPNSLGRVGPYEVVGVIGRGGMGVVFKALDPALNRYVAIKMLLPHLAAAGAARKRFAREAQAAAAVIDDHVMPIHSVAEWQGLPYLVTPYSRGTTLQKRIQDKGPLELKEILRIGMQMARGLAAAHAQGLVHRDVKPSNILLDGTVDRALLTDFGLARAVDDASITRTGIIAGTPQYMSPEQASGGSVDHRSDLFGLGSVLYAMCTGRPPFRADNTYAILRLITDKAPTPIREINPDIPVWLAAIIGRLMAKKAEERYATAAEVATLLERYLAHVQQPTEIPLPVNESQRWGRWSAFFAGGKGGLIMLGMFLLGFAGMLFAQTEPPDIAGVWNATEWGDVQLKQTGGGNYEGNYSETNGGEPGAIALKWSRIECRFNGTWNEGKGERFGNISLRLVGEKIQGAFTTDKGSRINPETPKIGDLVWVRGIGALDRSLSAASAVKTAPAQTKTGSAHGASDSPNGKRLSFSFDRKPWSQVFEWLTNVTDLPVITTFKPTGTFTFQGEKGKQYTTAEVIDIINEALLTGTDTQKFFLLRRQRSFTLVPVDEKIDGGLRSHLEMSDLEGYPDRVVVQVVLPLKNLVAEDLVTEVKKVLGPNGRVIPMDQSNQLVLSDTVANLKRIDKLIKSLEEGKGTAQAETLIHECKYIKARSVAEVLKEAIGGPKVAHSQAKLGQSQIDPRTGSPVVPKRVPFNITADDRTNSLIVTGTAEELARTREVLKVIDRNRPGQVFEFKTWAIGPFQWISAEAAARAVQGVYKEFVLATAESGNAGGLPGAGGNGGAGKPILSIAVDTKSNSLSLYCPQNQYEDIAKLVACMESAAKPTPSQPSREVATGNFNRSEADAYRPQMKRVNADAAFLFIRELMELMNLAIDVSVQGNGQFTFHRNREGNHRWLPRAKALALVLQQPDPAEGEAGRRKHCVQCLTLIDELLQFNRYQMQTGWRERALNGGQESGPKITALSDIAKEAARANLDHWNQLDRIEVPLPKDDPHFTDNMNRFKALLRPFFLDDAAVDRIIAKGGAKGDFSFPQNDGRQRLIAKLLVLRDTNRADGADFPNEEWKEFMAARLEVLETLRLVLANENGAASSTNGARDSMREEIRREEVQVPEKLEVQTGGRGSVEDSRLAAPGGFWPRVAGGDMGGMIFPFTLALAQTMDLKLGIRDDGAIRWFPENDPRSLPRARILARVLVLPEPNEGEAGRAKHRERCLELIAELGKYHDEQMSKAWQERVKTGVSAPPGNEIRIWRDRAHEIARTNLACWNQLDAIATTARQEVSPALGKVNVVRILLLHFFRERSTVEQIMAKGMVEGQFSFPRMDGRQRLLAQLFLLMDAKDTDAVQLPLEEWKSLQIARMEVLETLRLVLTRENETAVLSGGLLGPARNLPGGAVASGQGQDKINQPLKDLIEGVWEMDLPKSLQELPPNKQPYFVVLAEPGKAQGTQPTLWYAMYMGRERQSASRFILDKKSGSFSMVGPSNVAIHGLYEVRNDRLLMCYVRQPQMLPKTIEPGQGRELHDFKRLKGIVAEDLFNDLREHVKKAKWEEELLNSKRSSSKESEKSRWQAKSELVLDEQVNRWAVSPDGKRIALALRLKGKQETESDFVDIFDLNSKKLVLKLKVTPSETEKESGAVPKKPPTPVEITALAFSPNGKTIAIGNSIGQVRLYDAATGGFAFTLDGKQPSVAGSSVPAPAASGPAAPAPTSQGFVPSPTGGSETKKAFPLALVEVASLAFSPDGSVLVALGSQMETPPGSSGSSSESRPARAYQMPGRVLVWDLKDRKILRKLDENVQVQQFAFVQNLHDSSGKPASALVLATLGKWTEGSKARHGVIFWKIEDGSRAAVLSLEGTAWNSPPGFSWEVGILSENQENPNGANRIRVFSAKGAELPSSFAFSRDGAMLAIAHAQSSEHSEFRQANTIRLLRPNHSPMWSALEPNGAQVLGMTADGKGIIILSAGQSLRILDAASGKASEEYRLSDMRKGGKWNQGRILPQGNLIALTGVDQDGRGTIDLVDLDVLRKQPALDQVPLADAGPELSGKWIDESKTEQSYTIRKVENSKTDILVISDFGTEERLTWSPLAKRYEGSGQLTGGEHYRIFVTPTLGGQKLAVAWNFDEAWREKWFQHKAPRFPQITPELLQSLQKEYDEQFQRVWIQEKPGAKRKPPFDPLVEQPW